MPALGLTRLMAHRGVVADPERRCEQADAHRQHNDHRVVDVVDAQLLGDRKEEGAEDHDGRDSFEHASEDDERNDRDGDEAGGAARQSASWLPPAAARSRTG